jgi:4-amino-4-deoxy-L-arabinose transferase-like glycosyltransferase
MKRTLSTKKLYLTHPLFIALCFVFFYTAIFYYALGSYPLLNNNEGLYAEIPREMLSSGNWLIPHLNGVLYIEKPPLLYWLIALNYKFFGISEWSARAIPATAGLATCLSLLFFSLRQKIAKIYWLPSFILATSLGYVVTARIVMFDCLFTCFITASLLLLYLWATQGHSKYLRFAYASLALAVLTKGLVALILVGGVVLALLFFIKSPGSKWTKIKALFDPLALLIFLAIVLPWHIAASLQQDGFAWFYFINEHFLRFLGLREPRDYYGGPFYYYFIRIPLYLFPWSWFLLALCKRTKNKCSFAPRLQPIQLLSCHDNQPFIKFCWVWFLFFLFFFSISAAKANYYLVAAFPPLAFLIAHKLEQCGGRNGGCNLSKILATLSGAGGILFCGFYLFARDLLLNFSLLSSVWTLNTGIYVLAGYSIVGIVAMWIKPMWIKPNRKPIPSLPYLYIGGLCTIILLLALQLAPILQNTYSAKWVVQLIPPQYQNNVFIYHDFEQYSSLPFYLRHNVSIIESNSSDLEYGEKKQTQQSHPQPHTTYTSIIADKPLTQKIFISNSEFNNLCSKQQIYLVIRPQYVTELPNQSICKFTVIKNTRDLILLTNLR